MQKLQQMQEQSRSANGELGTKKRSRLTKATSKNYSNINTFDPNKYMLKLTKSKKVKLANGQVKWDQVSPRRYRTGVWLFWISIIVQLLVFYFFTENLRNGNQPGWAFSVTVGTEIFFIISFFVLGAEFWNKLRALFQYNARVVVEEPYL